MILSYIQMFQSEFQSKYDGMCSTVVKSTKDEEAIKVLIVRHPFVRLISSWNEKYSREHKHAKHYFKTSRGFEKYNKLLFVTFSILQRLYCILKVNLNEPENRTNGTRTKLRPIWLLFETLSRGQHLNRVLKIPTLHHRLKCASHVRITIF